MLCDDLELRGRTGRGVVESVQLGHVRPTLDGVDVVGRDMTKTGPQGPVFVNVDIRVAANALAAVVGPSGSGRTSFLLALCGRLRLTAGQLHVAGHPLPARATTVRELVAPARLRPGMELEQRLRVHESVRERESINDLDERATTRAFEFLELDHIDRNSLVSELPPVDQLLLALALTIADRPAGVVVDDVESGLPSADQERAWSALRAVSRTGITVLASATVAPEDLIAVRLRDKKTETHSEERGK